MATAAELIKALAALAWPALGFYLAWRFETEGRALLSRLKRAKGPGTELEFGPELDRLERQVNDAAAQLPDSRVAAPDGQRDKKLDRVEELHIIETLAQSPKAALLMLAVEIDREIRHLLAASGWHRSPHIRTDVIQDAIAELDRRGVVPRSLASSLKAFWEVRNRLVHGRTASDDDILRAVDIGLVILRTIKAVPAAINVIHDPGAEVFEDECGEKKRADVRALVLETTSPGGLEVTRAAYPTTLSHFQKGKRVALEWNDAKVFGRCWYRDQDTGKIQKGWDSSMEFVGRHLEDV